MTAIRKYEFDLDFDELETELAKRARAKKEEEKPPEPTFTQAQIDAAVAQVRQEAYERGLAEGQAAARSETMSSIEARTAASLGTMAENFRSLADSYANLFANLERDAVAVAHAIARKALPEIARESALARTEELVRFCLSRIVEEPRVVVRVHDEMLDSVQPRIQELGASVGFGGQMIFLADSLLEPGDCRIEWADGGAETGTDRIWQEIDRVVDQFFQALDSRAPLSGAEDRSDAADDAAMPTAETEPGAEAPPELASSRGDT